MWQPTAATYTSHPMGAGTAGGSEEAERCLRSYDGSHNIFAERGQELNIIVRFRHVLQQSLSSLECTFAALLVCQRREHAAHNNNGTQRAVIEQQFLAPCAGASNIDGGKNTALGQSSFKHKLHLTGTFAFFVDYLIHTAAGLNQCSSDNGQTTTVLDITCCSEEALGRKQGTGI